MDITTYKPPTWDQFFMLHVYLAASKSKDPSTKIGAVIVKDNILLSEGYNGFCRGVNDNVLKRWERPEKYFWAEHGERNSIFNAARNGIKTLDSTMFTNSTPCVDCARSVIQAGIKELILHKGHEDLWKDIMKEQWINHHKVSTEMLLEAGISIKYLDKKLGVQTVIAEKLFVV